MLFLGSFLAQFVSWCRCLFRLTFFRCLFQSWNAASASSSFQLLKYSCAGQVMLRGSSVGSVRASMAVSSCAVSCDMAVLFLLFCTFVPVKRNCHCDKPHTALKYVRSSHCHVVLLSRLCWVQSFPLSYFWPGAEIMGKLCTPMYSCACVVD